MTRANPTHPGGSFLHNTLEPLELSIADAAAHLKVEERALTAICDERAPITADIAYRFEQAFGTSAKFWLRRQAEYDLAQARRSCEPIERIVPEPTAAD